MTKSLYINANVYDGIHNEIKKNIWILINNTTGKIEQIDSGSRPEADHVIDLASQYVMPGLINVHTHVTSNPDSPTGNTDVSESQATVRALRSLHQLLKSGVTYVRGCGATYDLDITLANLEKAGKLDKVPHILPAGGPYSMTGGHGDMPNWGHLVDSPDEVRKSVRKGIKKGAKSLKLMATGGIMTPKDFMDDPQLSIEDMHTAVEEAHHKGLITEAHAEGNPGIYNAIKAGVDSIEHGFSVNDEEIDLMKQKGTYLTPTLITAWTIVKNGPGKLPGWELAKANDAWKRLVENIKNAWHRGVPITLGTDSGAPLDYYDFTPKELELMVEYEDVSNFTALQTLNNSAKLLKINDQYGTIESNKYADFLVLKHNPLKDIKAVQQEDKAVYQHGRQVY